MQEPSGVRGARVADLEVGASDGVDEQRVACDHRDAVDGDPDLCRR